MYTENVEWTSLEVRVVPYILHTQLSQLSPHLTFLKRKDDWLEEDIVHDKP